MKGSSQVVVGVFVAWFWRGIFLLSLCRCLGRRLALSSGGLFRLRSFDLLVFLPRLFLSSLFRPRLAAPCRRLALASAGRFRFLLLLLRLLRLFMTLL